MKTLARLLVSSSICLGLMGLLAAAMTCKSQASAGGNVGPVTREAEQAASSKAVHWESAVIPRTSTLISLYLPSILRNWTALPAVPQLLSITDPGISRQYTVTWLAASRAITYVLQEDTNEGFQGASDVYTGTGTTTIREPKGISYYFYRVKAQNDSGDSGWSASQSAYVRWEGEPNDSDSPNGPLETGRDYYGFQNDTKDFFFLDTNASGTITVDLSDFSGQGVQLQLFYQQISPANRVASRTGAPYMIEYDGDPGRYFIYIYTESGWNTIAPYILRATFP